MCSIILLCYKFLEALLAIWKIGCHYSSHQTVKFISSQLWETYPQQFAAISLNGRQLSPVNELHSISIFNLKNLSGLFLILANCKTSLLTEFSARS